MTKDLAGWIAQSRSYLLLREPNLNLVCFRHKSGNKKTEQILKRANATGKIFITHTVIDDHFYIRFCIGQEHTTIEDVQDAWKILEKLS